MLALHATRTLVYVTMYMPRLIQFIVTARVSHTLIILSQFSLIFELMPFIIIFSLNKKILSPALMKFIKALIINKPKF